MAKETMRGFLKTHWTGIFCIETLILFSLAGVVALLGGPAVTESHGPRDLLVLGSVCLALGLLPFLRRLRRLAAPRKRG